MKNENGHTQRSLPKISSYGHYSSDNYGTHSLQVEIGVLDLYFSYRTVVAFRSPETGLIARQNDWGPTTGKHLKWIDGANVRVNNRLTGEAFEAKLAECLKRYGLNDAA